MINEVKPIPDIRKSVPAALYAQHCLEGNIWPAVRTVRIVALSLLLLFVAGLVGRGFPSHG